MNSKKTGAINISRKNIIGKHIASFIRYSNLPVKQSSGVVLNISNTPYNDENYYCYFSVRDQHQINDYLDSLFIIFFQKIMVEGKRQNRMFKTIIEIFISYFSLENDPTIYDRLKKFDYRDREYHASIVTKGFHRLSNQYITK